jgi:uncharacterized protein (DUF1697 family)
MQGKVPRTYIALLRGVNLGAHNKVAMADLRALFESLGHEDVATYVQSGNVVFRSGTTDVAQLTKALERQVSRNLGLTISIVLRTKAQLTRVAAGNPFAKRQAEPTRLHVTFLADAPARARVRDLATTQFAPDEFLVKGKEIYLHTPRGYGRTKLNGAFFERQLGVVATTRNWRTVTKLAELASA